MNIYEELERLKRLLDNGAITNEEYEREKERIFSSGSFTKEDGWDLGIDDKSLVALMQASQFLSSFIIPLIMWLFLREKSPFLDEAGKKIINFQLSYLIYSILLTISCIGIAILPVIGLLMTIFIIIAIIKAINGEAWDYPFSIRFLK